MDSQIEEHIQSMIDGGYTSKDGTPLRCVHCESKDLEDKPYYENHSIIEIDVWCKACGKDVGHWSYGNWAV